MRLKRKRIILSHLIPILFIIAGVVWPVFPLLAQKTTKVYIEHADLLKFASENGTDVQILMGNAILRQDSTYFYCDTASLYENNNLRAVGRVHISYSDSVHLYGDYLTYNGNTKIAVLDSNVRLVDSTRATLYTDHLEYDRNQAIAYYFTGGRIVDDENVLTSKTGRYFTRTSEFLFRDSVVVVNPDYTMYSDTLRYNTESEIVYIEGPTDLYGTDDHIYSEKGWYDTRINQAELSRNNRIIHLEQILKGDWIFYDQEKEYGKAIGNVWLKDTVQNVILEGGIGEFYRGEKYSYITDSARAILIDTYDSLYMHADSFIMVLDSADDPRFIFAYNHMKFFKEDLQGMCDSLVFRVQDSVIALLKNPVIWSDENQLTADSMWMHVSDNRIDSMVLFNMAFIISRDSTDSYNQIKGKQMKAYFRNNQLYRIRVQGNAETIYFVREEDYDLIGINRSVSSNMVIMLDDRKVKKIFYLTQPESTLFPEKDLPGEDRFLRDFKWITDQRPADRKAIFNWEESGSEN
jgi:lipopolysaccharide export system protein LptA